MFVVMKETGKGKIVTLNDATMTEIRSEEAFYWRTSNGTELDLLLQYKDRKIGVECKFTDAPKRSKSMSVAIEDLKLDILYIIYPGGRSYQIDDKISVLSINDLKDIKH